MESQNMYKVPPSDLILKSNDRMKNFGIFEAENQVNLCKKVNQMKNLSSHISFEIMGKILHPQNNIFYEIRIQVFQGLLRLWMSHKTYSDYKDGFISTSRLKSQSSSGEEDEEGEDIVVQAELCKIQIIEKMNENLDKDQNHKKCLHLLLHESNLQENDKNVEKPKLIIIGFNSFENYNYLKNQIRVGTVQLKFYDYYYEVKVLEEENPVSLILANKINELNKIYLTKRIRKKYAKRSTEAFEKLILNEIYQRRNSRKIFNEVFESTHFYYFVYNGGHFYDNIFTFEDLFKINCDEKILILLNFIVENQKLTSKLLDNQSSKGLNRLLSMPFLFDNKMPLINWIKDLIELGFSIKDSKGNYQRDCLYALHKICQIGKENINEATQKQKLILEKIHKIIKYNKDLIGEKNGSLKIIEKIKSYLKSCFEKLENREFSENEFDFEEFSENGGNFSDNNNTWNSMHDFNLKYGLRSKKLISKLNQSLKPIKKKDFKYSGTFGPK